MNLPNKITVTRLFLTLVIIVMLVIPYSSLGINVMTFDVGGVKVELTYIIAGVIFIIASLTDFLDGYLARKYEVSTFFGALLDGMFDKLFGFISFNPIAFVYVLLPIL